MQAEQIDDEIAELRRQEVEDIRQLSMGQYQHTSFEGYLSWHPKDFWVSLECDFAYHPMAAYFSNLVRMAIGYRYDFAFAKVSAIGLAKASRGAWASSAKLWQPRTDLPIWWGLMRVDPHFFLPKSRCQFSKVWQIHQQKGLNVGTST